MGGSVILYDRVAKINQIFDNGSPYAKKKPQLYAAVERVVDVYRARE